MLESNGRKLLYLTTEQPGWQENINLAMKPRPLELGQDRNRVYT